MQPPFVKIVWIDAEDAKDTWIDAEDEAAYADSECLIISWGYLVKKTKAYTVLAADLGTGSSGAKTFGRVTKIPTAWIRQTTVMQKAQAA